MTAKRLLVALTGTVLLAVLTGGPWYLGQRAEQVYRAEVAALGRQPQALRVVSESYSRGWFQSQARLELSPAAGDLAKDLRLRIDSRVSHGPHVLADLGWPPALARVASTIHVEHPELRLAGVQADTRIGWNGASLTRLRLPALDQPANGDRPGVRTLPGQAEVRFSPAAGSLQASIDLPSLELRQSGGKLLMAVRDLHAANSSVPWVGGLRLVSGDVVLGHLNAHLDSGPLGAVEARDLRLSVLSQPGDGLLDFHLSSGAGALRIQGADYAPSQVQVSVTRLDGATLAALQQDLEVLAGRDLPEAMLGIASAALLMRHLPALAAADPCLAVERLDIATPSGPVTAHLSLGVQGLTAGDLEAGGGAWLRRLVVDGEMSLPRTVAVSLVAFLRHGQDAPGEVTPQRAEAQAAAAAREVDGLLRDGWISVDGERLTTVVKLGDGLLTVNGKTLPTGGVLPL